ncbi:MAG: hypothetical protein HYZ63_03050 [Candidatus Andersenbacteria bacterium]|nr:hypothetical protein [Candidatus Andersenbacteria bacterium]
MNPSPSSPIATATKAPKIDSQELILCTQPNYVCETYIFEPSPGEEHLGYLFAAAETEDRGGVGKELVDVVISAIQREYFRDRQRSPMQSFELALHQANLILHDAAERGVRDWMGYFHVSIGALVGRQLHVSVAGGASVWLARKTVMTCVSEGLAHLPITNPLRTFSQVASGEVATRDVILLATGNFEHVFRPQDVARFTIDHSAATISARLQQLYKDQQYTAPLSVVTVALLPDYIVAPREEPAFYKPRQAASASPDNLKPRKPLLIRKPGWRTVVLALSQSVQMAWRAFRAHAWLHVKRGGTLMGAGLTRGTGALVMMSKQPGARVQGPRDPELTPINPSPRKPKSWSHIMSNILAFFRDMPRRLWRGLLRLPTTSKIFGVMALVLVVVLVFSLRALQNKRALDQDIQRASELLHEAQTKQEAAAAALIYENRDQAKALLDQAQGAATSLSASGFYEAETREVQTAIQTQLDRLQKISRATGGAAPTVGDFASQLAGQPASPAGRQPIALFLVGEKLYTFNPSNNAIVAMDLGGQTSVVSEETKEIGFFTNGAVQTADKTILLTTGDPGLALFDTKDNSLSRQEIALAEDKTALGPLALFGNRLYVFDATVNNILTFNKTLRGFAGGTPWISDSSFPASSIKSLAVDGSIYTLHSDGSIRRLFKGVGAEFTLDTLDPPLTSASKIITGEDFKSLYVLDPQKKRVVVLTKKGALVKQIFFANEADIKDVAIDAKEENLYALDGTKVIKVPLVEVSASPTANPAN